jgi:hypothetical protein
MAGPVGSRAYSPKRPRPPPDRQSESQVLIHFDEATLQAIDRIAPAAKRKRADFIRSVVKNEIFRLETERMRQAYRLQPDSAEARTTGTYLRNGRARPWAGGS